MNHRFLVWAAAVLAGLIFVPLATGPASARVPSAESSAVSLDRLLGEAGSSLSRAGTPSNAPAQVSRRKRRRAPRMTVGRARSNAFRLAEDVYLDPEFNFDDYGVGRCLRQSRTRVDCYSYVSEDVYHDYSYEYLDTIYCDWFTNSAFRRNGRMKVWISNIDCVSLSEV